MLMDHESYVSIEDEASANNNEPIAQKKEQIVPEKVEKEPERIAL